jgi:prolyl oligopeptidase
MKRNRRITVMALAIILVVANVVQGQSQRLPYPMPRKSDVVDDYFGTKVADPYRWMEDLDSSEVVDWVAVENKLTFDYLERLPLRQHFRQRLTELWNYPRITIPVREGGRLFYRKNSGLQRQSPIYMRESLAVSPTVVIDPNALSPDGAVSLANYAPSPDAKLLAYTLSEGGADWQTGRVREIGSGRDLPDEVQWMRFSWLSWTKDGRGFFYSRYPEPPKGKHLQAALSGQALYYHRVGTPQSQDRLIYERKDLPTWFIGGWVTEDGRYLLVRLAKGSGNRNRLYYADLGTPSRPKVKAEIKPIIEDDDAEYAPFGNIGPMLYLRTDSDAPNRKIIAVDLRNPKRSAWKTLVPERKEAIQSVDLIGGRIVAEYLVNVRSRLALFDRAGRSQGEIALPGIGTVGGVGGRQDSLEIFYAFTSPLYRTTVFAYDPRIKKSTPFEAPDPALDVSRYETKQFFAISKDGTRIPFFLTAHKDLPRTGDNPTMLYGYGGYSIVTMPVYRPHALAWLELGGIWVTASLRGGGEYGENWHKGGMLENKQNVFDDFIAVAEQLINEKYTSPAKLGIMGGSNGGLLVAAVTEQRPELYGVALPAVGVMDMLRYDKFTGGRAWIPEYGSSSDPEQFKYLIKYSPLHNIKPGVCYPAIMLTTADHDDRVVPSHSFKFTATLQEAQGCDRPVLIRVETKASHGYRPTDKLIAELADVWAFAAAQMGIRDIGDMLNKVSERQPKGTEP